MKTNVATPSLLLSRAMIIRTARRPIRSIACLFLVFLVSLDACHNPLDGVKLGLKDPILDGVVECRFYDPAGNPLPKDNEVRVAGPDAAQVVTTLNTTRYKINSDNNLLVAASPLATYSGQRPFRFTVVVEADPYLAVVQPFQLTGPDRQTRYIPRYNLNRLPLALSAGRTTGTAGIDGTVATTVNLTTAGQNKDGDQATVTVPTGTKLTDRDGQPVGSKLTLAVIHTNTRTNETYRFLPGGDVLSNVNARLSAPAPGTMRLLSVAGAVNMQVYNQSYALATALSQPIRWTMDLNPATLNLSRGRSIQEGDSIPLFSYDAFTYRWQVEKPGVVRRNSQTNRLEYQADARFVATYVAGWTESICDVGPVFKVSSKLANVDVNYLCKVIDVATGQQVSAFYANVNNGSIIGIYNQSKNRQLKLMVYDETDAWGKGANGGLIGQSGPGTTCDQTPVAINLATLPVPPVMNLEFVFSCPGGTTLDESSLPSLIKTQYSEVGQENWHDLISATRTQRKVESYKIQVGRYYDFRASTDGGASWPLRQNNYYVDKPEWTLKIRAEMYCK